MRNKFADLTGQRFGKLVVLRDGWTPGCREAKWVCRCDCGNEAHVRGTFLRRGKVQSCGCWRREFAKKSGEGTTEQRRMLAAARHGSKARGLDFDISFADIAIPDRCPVLGIPLFRSGDSRAANTPSLDRIDNTRGYVKGNVAVISWRANQLKRDASLAEIEALALWMRACLQA